MAKFSRTFAPALPQTGVANAAIDEAIAESGIFSDSGTQSLR
jgi:hypothetical protein